MANTKADIRAFVQHYIRECGYMGHFSTIISSLDEKHRDQTRRLVIGINIGGGEHIQAAVEFADDRHLWDNETHALKHLVRDMADYLCYEHINRTFSAHVDHSYGNWNFILWPWSTESTTRILMALGIEEMPRYATHPFSVIANISAGRLLEHL